MTVNPANVPCGTCEAPSIVVVNGRGGCLAHVDDAMAVVGKVVDAIRTLASVGRGSEMHFGVVTSYDDPAAELLVHLNHRNGAVWCGYGIAQVEHTRDPAKTTCPDCREIAKRFEGATS